MRSTDILSPRRLAIWNLVRHLMPNKQRWYYEGHPPLRGQLWYAERKLLYETIRKYRPAVCFEIGTWMGGGSTLFVAQALHDNGAGILHTIEIDRKFYEEATSNYPRLLPHLQPHVAFHFGDYRVVYRETLSGVGQVDFLLLDGAENAEETLAQYQFFRPYFRSGSHLMAHDWNTAKCELLRGEMERTGEWEILTMLSPPRSLGLMLAARRNG
jgi:cephalosporin hydroxylase